MRESQQAHLLSQYVESLKHNPDATPPADLDEEMAIFAKQFKRRRGKAFCTAEFAYLLRELRKYLSIYQDRHRLPTYAPASCRLIVLMVCFSL